MKNTLPVEKNSYPFFLYCSDLSRLKKAGTAPRYEESFFDSSEDETRVAEFALSTMFENDLAPTLNKFRYRYPRTSNHFSRLLLDILLRLRCSWTTARFENVSSPSQEVSIPSELVNNLLRAPNMKTISVSPALKENWEKMKNEYIAPMTASLLLWLESSPEENDGE
jgi:hypothetical protein